MKRTTTPKDSLPNTIDQIEIISLDPPKQQQRRERALFFLSPSPRSRTVIVGGACLAFVVLLVLILQASLFPPKKPLAESTLNSTPVTSIIVGQQRYTTYEDGSLAASSPSGSLFWHRTIGVWGTPMVQNPTVYVNLLNGGVAALNTHDGSLKWKFQIPASPSSLLRVSREHVFVYYQHVRTFDGGVVVLQPNGSLLWKTHTFRFSRLVDGNEGIVYICKSDGVLEARRVRDGFLLWYLQRQGGSLSLIKERNVLYSWNQQGSLDALRARDGLLLWHIQEKRRILSVTPYSNHIFIEFLDGCGIDRKVQDGSLLLAIPARKPICL